MSPFHRNRNQDPGQQPFVTGPSGPQMNGIVDEKGEEFQHPDPASHSNTWNSQNTSHTQGTYSSTNTQQPLSIAGRSDQPPDNPVKRLVQYVCCFCWISNEVYEDYCINSCWSCCFGKRWLWPTPYECFPVMGEWFTPQSVRRRVDVLVATEPDPICQSCYENVVDCITCTLCCVCQRIDDHLDNRRKRIEGRENKVGKMQGKAQNRQDREEAMTKYKKARAAVKERNSKALAKATDKNSVILEQMPPKPPGTLDRLGFRFGKKNKGQQRQQGGEFQQQGGEFQQQTAQYTQDGQSQGPPRYSTITGPHGGPTHQQYGHHTH